MVRILISSRVVLAWQRYVARRMLPLCKQYQLFISQRAASEAVDGTENEPNLYEEAVDIKTSLTYRSMYFAAAQKLCKNKW